VGRLADLETGTISLPFNGTVQGAPSFSDLGRRLAISRSASTPGTDFRVEVHDPAAGLAATGVLPNPLWRSPATSAEPALSADGTFLAYLIVNTAGTNAVVVTDWALNHQVFARRLPTSVVPSGLRLSAEGRFAIWLAASSAASAGNQVWRGDVRAGTVTLVSVAPDGASESNGNSRYAAINPNGRYVAFASQADNLAGDDTNGAKDVFLRDMNTGQTLLVSRGPSGKPGGGWSFQPFFSADGRSLFFLSGAADLASGDYNQLVDLYKIEFLTDAGLLLAVRRNLSTGRTEVLWNRQAGKTYRVEFEDDLPAADWTALPGEFTGDAPVEVDTTASLHRFLRLRAL
jgi:Tol biopolymer transport system component